MVAATSAKKGVWWRRPGGRDTQRNGGGSLGAATAGRRQLGVGNSTAKVAWRQHGGGSLVAATEWLRQLDSGEVAAAAQWRLLTAATALQQRNGGSIFCCGSMGAATVLRRQLGKKGRAGGNAVAALNVAAAAAWQWRDGGGSAVEGKYT